jgi:hypothetical protein
MWQQRRKKKRFFFNLSPGGQRWLPVEKAENKKILKIVKTVTAFSAEKHFRCH